MRKLLKQKLTKKLITQSNNLLIEHLTEDLQATGNSFICISLNELKWYRADITKKYHEYILKLVRILQDEIGTVQGGGIWGKTDLQSRIEFLRFVELTLRHRAVYSNEEIIQQYLKEVYYAKG